MSGGAGGRGDVPYCTNMEWLAKFDTGFVATLLEIRDLQCELRQESSILLSEVLETGRCEWQDASGHAVTLREYIAEKTSKIAFIDEQLALMEYDCVYQSVSLPQARGSILQREIQQGGSVHDALVQAQESDSSRSQDGLDMEEDTGVDSAGEFQSKAWWSR